MNTDTNLQYDVNFVVKYKQIEDELNEKIAKNKLEEEGKREELEYDETDVQNIIDELYRHELLGVFKTEDITDEKIVDTIEKILEQIRNYQPFYRVFTLYLERKIDYDSLQDIEIEGFVSLFSYEMFHYLHSCICEFLTTREIPSDILQKWKDFILLE